MQQAVAVAPQKVNEMKRLGVTRYALSLFAVDLAGRDTGQRSLPEKGIVQFMDIHVLYPNHAESAFSGTPGTAEYVRKPKTSLAIINELQATYANTGFLYLPMLDDAPADFVSFLENELIPTRQVERLGAKYAEPLSLREIAEYLAGYQGKLPPQYKALTETAVKTQRAIYEHLTRLIPALQQELAAYQAEYAARKRGEPGLAFYSPDMKKRASEIGVTLVEDGGETMQAPTVPAGIDPAVAQILNSQNQILSALTEAVKTLAAK